MMLRIREYGNYADLSVRTSRNEDGFMKDARRSQHNNDRNDGSRYDGSSDRHMRFQLGQDRNYDKGASKVGGNDRKIVSTSSRHGSRYAPYGTRKSQTWRIKERRVSREVGDANEPYARSPQPARSERSSTSKSDEIIDQEGHCSSDKRIASTIVTPVRYHHDVNVTKRGKGITRSITFSPKEKGSPAEDQIIGALTDMGIGGTSNTIDEVYDKEMMIEDQEDDLLGEDVMEMEV
ncbi:hypothetical protein Bca101_050105 [Brassica carinata]